MVLERTIPDLLLTKMELKPIWHLPLNYTSDVGLNRNLPLCFWRSLCQTPQCHVTVELCICSPFTSRQQVSLETLWTLAWRSKKWGCPPLTVQAFRKQRKCLFEVRILVFDLMSCPVRCPVHSWSSPVQQVVSHDGQRQDFRAWSKSLATVSHQTRVTCVPCTAPLASVGVCNQTVNVIRGKIRWLSNYYITVIKYYYEAQRVISFLPSFLIVFFVLFLSFSSSWFLSLLSSILSLLTFFFILSIDLSDPMSFSIPCSSSFPFF